MSADCRPVGVFDSGLGGLSAVREIRRRLPGEDIVYFGDTGRVPYGTRSPETIRRYAEEDMRFLMTKSPKAIVIACGTISSVALDVCHAAFDGPVLGVIAPACDAAVRATKNRKIGVIATASTVSSEAYPRALSALDATLSVRAVACPLFVPLVENGFTDPDDPVPSLVAQRYLAPLVAWGCDTLILGCTHYPHLAPVLSRVMPGAALIDTGAEVAGALAGALRCAQLQQSPAHTGTCRFFVSDRTEGFAASAASFLGESVEGQVCHIDLSELSTQS